MKPRVFMIGWDGATFDLIRPWVVQGKLPTIAKLLQAGVHGPLRSTIPPWTFPAWTSFMTGKNPGKHGIYDFLRQRRGSYDLEFVNGSHRRALTLWQILSHAGRNVISISIPCTFPPDPVNGVMISGFDFPGEGPGSFVDAKGIYPPELYDELNQTVGPHPIDTPIIKEINEGRPAVALERILETIRRKAATAKYLLNRPWDCFMILFGESDGCAHHLWKYCDPQSPLFVDQPAGLRDSILRVYQELDRQTGELLELLPADTTVALMSDHGFGGSSNWVIYPNCWLHELGALEFRGEWTQRISRMREALKHRAVASLPSWTQRHLFRLAGRRLGSFEAHLRHGIIDWRNTEAYFEENPYFPVLRINLKGREPHGTVEPGRHYEQVRDRLIRELEAWRHPGSSDSIVEKAYRREEVYSGPCVEDAADVIPKWALHKGYNYVFRLSSQSPGLACIEHVSPRRGDRFQYFTNKSGSHRDYGIFLAQGPRLRSGVTVDDARIIDLAPTILHLLHVPVPEDMDDRILEEIFAEPSRGPFMTEGPSGLSAVAASSETGSYSLEDETKISERLQSLGYLE